jgi:replicative DNA helicase
MAIIEQTEGRLFGSLKRETTGGGVQTLYDALRKAAESAQLALNHDGGLTGLTTGLQEPRSPAGWPAALRYHYPGRPSMRKTALAANIGVNAARRHTQTKGRGSGRALLA